jgi:hypothetical protein
VQQQFVSGCVKIVVCLILDFEEQSCFDYDFQLRVVIAQIKTTTNICRTFASLSEFGQECCFGLDI